ncbi:MAG TPA: hypothetical protein PLD10_11195, partial [Rhodopila sp.]|nr:hypothetical protein [Rhodopila sp.]
MHFLKVYGRVIGLFRAEWRAGVLLAVANLAIAGVAFLEPVLFGRVVQLLSRSTSSKRPAKAACSATCKRGRT